MKICITGGSGFIGSALTRVLLKLGYSLRILDDESRGSFQRLADVKDQLEFYCGDIRHYQTVREATKGVDGIIHLAAVNGTATFYSDPGRVLGVAVKGITNVMDACVANGIHNLVVASSSEVYQEPSVIPTPEDVPLVVPDLNNPRYSYGGGKITTELMARYYYNDQIKRVVIFRPHNVYGPNMGYGHVIPQFIRRLYNSVSEEFPIEGTGDETRAYCYIDDAVSGIIKVIENGKDREVYNVGCSNVTPVAALARVIAGTMNKTIKVVPGELKKGSAKRRCPDLSKLINLGWTRRVPLFEGIQKTVEWYLKDLKREHLEV